MFEGYLTKTKKQILSCTPKKTFKKSTVYEIDVSVQSSERREPRERSERPRRSEAEAKNYK